MHGKSLANLIYFINILNCGTERVALQITTNVRDNLCPGSPTSPHLTTEYLSGVVYLFFSKVLIMATK